MATPLRVFYFFHPSRAKREAVAESGDAMLRRRRYGMDELRALGASVEHNLTREPPAWARLAGALLNRLVGAAGGYGGLFADVLANLRCANRADVIFSLNDKLGIPVLLLKRARLVRPPVVYVAVGLAERLERLRSPRGKRQVAAAFRRAAAIVVYSEAEAAWLREWLTPDPPRVLFVPFGVDIQAFVPANSAPGADVLSVGRDKRRDYALLIEVARRLPSLRFHVVMGAENARELGEVPANMTLETEISLERVRNHLAAARVVALPVQDNVYSGATTTLLQAMAMGKPVVVSQTAAIASGYNLESGVNCRLVAPGDTDAFEAALRDLLDDPARAASLGAAARSTAEDRLSWAQTARILVELLHEVAERRPRR